MGTDGNTMVVGRVKWFDARKGFGFIVDTQGRDVFVHFSVIDGEGFRRLHDGEKVQFLHAAGPKGLSAARVVRMEGVTVGGGDRLVLVPPGQESAN